MELHQANQLTDQTRKGEELAIRNEKIELIRKIVQEVVKKLKNYKECALQKLKRLDNEN